MKRTYLGLVLGTFLGISGLTWADHDAPHKNKAKVKTLSERDIVEKVAGKKSRATTVEVTLQPGEASAPHRHPGPVFGYVLEGEYELGLGEQPAKTLKAGDTFYEPAGSLHRVSRNPSRKNRTRLLAIVLHPRAAKHLVIPEPPAKKE